MEGKTPKTVDQKKGYIFGTGTRINHHMIATGQGTGDVKIMSVTFLAC